MYSGECLSISYLLLFNFEVIVKTLKHVMSNFPQGVNKVSELKLNCFELIVISLLRYNLFQPLKKNFLLLFFFFFFFYNPGLMRNQIHDLHSFSLSSLTTATATTKKLAKKFDNDQCWPWYGSHFEPDQLKTFSLPHEFPPYVHV